MTPLEAAVLDKLLDHAGEPFDTIRQQLSSASVVSREFSGAGFFTCFSLPQDSPVRRDLGNRELGPIGADITGLKDGAGFLLFIRDGIVSCLEGYCYDEPWPTIITDFRVF